MVGDSWYYIEWPDKGTAAAHVMIKHPVSLAEVAALKTLSSAITGLMN